MSLLSIALDQVTRREPAYLAKATDLARLTIEPVVSALYQPASVSEITDKIGLSETSVRKHIKAMVRCGDVVEVGHRPIRTALGIRRESLYRIKDAR